MEILDWLIAGTSVFGLVVYCAGMTLLLGALAWANHLDHRQENQATDALARSGAAASVANGIDLESDPCQRLVDAPTLRPRRRVCAT